MPRLKLKKRKKKLLLKADPKGLTATFVYNAKVARSFHDTSYYEAQQDRIKNLVSIEEIRNNMSTGKADIVTQILDSYKKRAEESELKIFRVLDNIKNKNIQHIRSKAPLPKHQNLLSIVGNIHILTAAYRTIRKNKGTMTRAWKIPVNEYNNLDPAQKELMDKLFTTPDGLDMNFLRQISVLVKKGIYPWGVSKLIWIPKPGTERLRPITIPPFADRIVQEAIRMVLEAIYEPTFQQMACSYGFRASNGVHNSITALSEPRLTSGLYMALEGDIEEAYPKLDRQILLNILSERIGDRKFLKFMRKRLHLRLFEVKKNKYEQTLLSIPQGGIDSPYLWNIYLLGMDKFIKEHLQLKFDLINQKRASSRGFGRANTKTLNTPVNPLYAKLDRLFLKKRAQYKLEKTTLKNTPPKTGFRNNYKNLFRLVDEIRLISHDKRNIRYFDPNRVPLRFNYQRYADDWIILTNAPLSIMQDIKKDIAHWLKTQRNATLSEKKTVITDMRKTPAHFLGFELKNLNTRRLKKVGPSTKRTAGWSISVYPDRTRLINRFFMKGYCDRNGFPREIPWLSTLDPVTIINRFNSVMTGLANFYCEFLSSKWSLGRWLYIIRWSAIKTLAQKYKTNCSGVFKRLAQNEHRLITATTKCTLPNKKTYYKDSILLTEKQAIENAMQINIKRELQKQLLKIERGETVFYDAEKKGRTPRILDINFLEKVNWVNFRTQATFDLPCCLCGSFPSEMHHIKHVRKSSFTLIDGRDTVARMQFLRNRRQVPLCRNCHLNKVHAGKYSGPPLRKLFDNRIISSENYVTIAKQPYEGKPLEEKLTDAGWKELT